jgi:hypothetical protein
VALAAAAPASAADPTFLKPLGWYAEGAVVPATVEFHDVAAAGDVVVAVGTDAGQPVIYNRTGGTWQHAPVEPPLPAAGTLTDVVLGGGGGWAIGTAGGTPLVLELVNGVWTDRSAGAALPAAPTAVAMSGAGAIIGDAGGSLHWLAAGGAKTDTKSPTAAGAINGVALVSGSPGLAVAGYKPLAGEPPDGSVRIYELRDPPLLDADESAPGETGVNMTGLAAVASNHAVAIDSTNATWRLTVAFGQNDWIREGQLPDAALSAATSVNGGPPPFDDTGWATEFLVGNTGGAGAIWHRTRWTKDGAAWNGDPVPAGTPALSGVAATAWDAAWAVGSGGTILRYWRPPDPDAEAAWRAQQQQQQQQQQQEQSQQETGTSTTGGTQVQTGPQQTTIVTIGEWQPSGSSTGDAGGDRLVTNGVVIEDGDDTPTPVRKRLVKNVRAIFTRTRSGRRKLIVRFRLTRRAVVSVAAKRGRRLIGSTRPRTLRRGRRQVVLPVRGKEPPTSLKLVARPVRRAT